MFQSLLGQNNVSSMTLITKVSHFRVPSMEVPLHTCMHVYVCACACACVYMRMYVHMYACVMLEHTDNTIYPRRRPGP